MSPDAGANYANLILSYAALNRLNDAKDIYEKAIARGVADDPLTHVSFFGVAFLEGDTAEMDRQMAWSAGKPEAEEIFLGARSDVEAYYGRLRSARSIPAGYRFRASQQREGDRGAVDVERGNSGSGIREFRPSARAAASALALSANHDSEILAALTFARAGDLPQADKLANSLAADYPRDTLVTSYWLPVIRAAIEIGGKKPSRALEAVEAATPYELAKPGCVARPRRASLSDLFAWGGAANVPSGE